LERFKPHTGHNKSCGTHRDTSVPMLSPSSEVVRQKYPNSNNAANTHIWNKRNYSTRM